MASTRQRILVRVLRQEQIIRERQEELRVFEMRYEMPSEKMATLVQLEAIRQASEVVQWNDTYYALKSLLKFQI